MLDRFYLIIDNLQWLARLCPEGLRFAQLRIKEPDGSLPQTVEKALAMARAHDCTLVINDHWQAAIDAGADWLHLGQEDLETADLPAIRKAGLNSGSRPIPPRSSTGRLVWTRTMSLLARSSPPGGSP